MKPSAIQTENRSLLFLFLGLLLLLFGAAIPAAADDRLQQNSETTFLDKATGSMWQLERSKRIKNADDAIDVIAALNKGEYQDWRFPTKQELSELFQVFDLKNNGEVKIALEGGYWLRQEDGAIQVGSWEIGDDCGPSRKFYDGRAGYVRAIRP